MKYCSECNPNKGYVDSKDINWGKCDVCKKDTAVVEVSTNNDFIDFFNNMIKEKK